MTLKAILVGTGGWGKSWCRQTLPHAVQAGLVQVVAAVDVSPANLAFAREYLGLAEHQCYTEVKEAFAGVKANICIIASPPHTHEEVAVLAMEHGCDVLSEKPIADTLEASIRIVKKMRSTGKKVGITMTHRFRQHIWTLRELMRSGQYGQLDYIVFNFNWNRRDGLKERQAKMENTMLIEGAVHHLDLLEDLAGAECESLFAEAWTPPWGNFTGSAQAFITMRFANSVRASYETAWCNASAQNGWEQEYIRAEFEKATVVLNRGKIECFMEESHDRKGELCGAPVPFKDNPKWANDHLLEEFIQWVQGGKEMETNIVSNLRSMILVHAAIESSRTGMPVEIRRFARDRGVELS